MDLGLPIDLKINGIKLTKPTSFNVKVLDLKEIVQLASGDTAVDVVATKREISVSFNTLSWEKCSELLTLISEPFFELTYPDPQTGIYETRTFTADDKTTPFAVKYEDKLFWNGVGMTLRER